MPVRRRLAIVACVLAVSLMAVAGQAATTSARRAATTYVVKRGDTLTSIAARYGTTPKAIAAANRIRNPNIVVIGNRLTIPGDGSSHVAGTLPTKLTAHPERLALRPIFEWWAARYGVPADLLEAIAWIESGWQSGVVSSTGARGIGQLQPATIDFTRSLIGINLDPASANDNIRMAARFLRFLLDRTGNNVNVSIAAYYQGLHAVTTGPALPETWHYVANVVAVRSSFS
ncbi:MAG TPA: LysM peptidoglycan-binding domain-containing protein [Acidimicrobiales bacterium]